MQIFINFIQLGLDEMLNMQECLQQTMKKIVEEWCHGDKDPQSSSKCCIFHCWKNVFPRGGVELRELKLSQVQRHMNPDRYIYSENVSKNRNGTFKQLNIANKVVPTNCFHVLKLENIALYVFLICTSASYQSLPIYFGNLYGCTINVNA